MSDRAIVGRTLSHYRIAATLGAGGMGEVYRATDTKLGRDVALKLLPEAFAADPERLARFEREAKLLASLNHPGIAHLYGFEAVTLEGGAAAHFIAMELVEGEDLAERLRRGAIPFDEAITIARQIAEALEAAHEKGIVHRDLKPANVKLTPDGRVRVLDFGLAKAWAGDASGTAPISDASQSPTLAHTGTAAGLILGTAAYMSPEQARGRPVDKRADIWAFGVVLYEMLSGRRLFEGETVSDVLASVLKTAPDWAQLPPATPRAVIRLLRRCLERDVRRRLRDVCDAQLDLDEAAAEPAEATRTPSRPPSRPARVWPIVAACVLSAALTTAFWYAWRPAAAIGPATRMSILPPPDRAIYPDSVEVALSPDGSTVAFVVGGVAAAGSQLWVRSLDSSVPQRLEGGDGARLPFWSPDSRRIGFFAGTKLKTIGVGGGRAEVLGEVTAARGGAWSPANVIVFAPDAGGPLLRIPASGGAPVPATQLDTARRQYGHRFPAFLPDGEHFLYAALPGRNGRFDVFAGSLAGGPPTLVGEMESAPVYAEPGFLLYARQGGLAAQPFDAQRLRVTGEPVLLEDEPSSIQDPAYSFTAGRSTSVSRTGALAYYSAGSNANLAVWLDATGRITGAIKAPAGHYEKVAVSPDGTRAVLVRSSSPSESDLWLVDLARGNSTPLSSGHGRNDAPVWSPDSARVVFSSDRDGAEDLFVKTLADASPETPLYRSAVPFKQASAWSPDGRIVVMTQLDPDTAQNIWLVPTSGKEPPRPFVRGPGRDNAGPISPDGHWLAYETDDTGRFELYVQSLPVPGHKLQVSEEGAGPVWWTPDGRGLVFADERRTSLWRADVATGSSLQVGTPRRIASLPPGVSWLDALPDRQRFIAIVPEHAGPGSVTVVQNWRAALAGQR